MEAKGGGRGESKKDGRKKYKLKAESHLFRGRSSNSVGKRANFFKLLLAKNGVLANIAKFNTQ